APGPARTYGRSFRFGVPEPIEFFGDEAYAKLYAQAFRKLLDMGGIPTKFDYAPFAEAAQLLYAGPWVAERTAAVGAFIEKADDRARVWPVTRYIILGGRKYSAVDAFEGQYKLKKLMDRAELAMRDVDFLAL